MSNHGYLPTNLSDVAIQNKVAKPVTRRRSKAAELVMNPATVDLGHLAGRNERQLSSGPPGASSGRRSRSAAEWLVRGGAGEKVTVTARSQKGGTHRLTAALQ